MNTFGFNGNGGLNRRVDDLEYLVKRVEVKNWKDVQDIVRAGLADKIFSIGDQLVSAYGTGTAVWDIIGINHDTPTDSQYTNSLTIQMHDILVTAKFDEPEALYYAEAELPAGNYYFTNSYESNKNYQFTLANAVPAGGIIFISAWSTNTPTQIKTYADKITTTAINTVSLTEGNTGTQLAPINDIRRCQYGSDRYINSAVRQWLNSNASTFAWESKSNFDRPVAAAPYTGAGFLNLLDPELVAVIGGVNKQVARNTIIDGGGQDLFNDKVFMLSRKEVYGGDEGVVTGENPYPYYSALAGSPTTGELAGRIKYNSSKAASSWWLRSPHTGYTYSPRYVVTTGSVGINLASNTFGPAPACCII